MGGTAKHKLYVKHISYSSIDWHRVITVSDREAGRCLEPEGNGVNPGGGNGRGPSPPSREQDKQLITSRGGGNSLMKRQGRREEKSGITKRTRCAYSTYCKYCEWSPFCM